MTHSTEPYSEERVRLIVREETADMRSDIADLRTDMDRQGILLEDVHSKLEAVLETLSDALGVKIRVGKHEERLDSLETNQRLLTATVKDHSRRLKAA